MIIAGLDHHGEVGTGEVTDQPPQNISLKWAPSQPLFHLFSSFSHFNNNLNFNVINRRKQRWFAWDLNPGPQDGKRRWTYEAMVATLSANLSYASYFLKILQANGTSQNTQFTNTECPI